MTVAAQHRILCTFGSFLLFCLFALASPVTARAQQDYTSEGGGQAQTQSIDQVTLEKFIEAARRLGDIRNEFSVKLQGVQDEEAAREIQAEMNDEMLAAVDDVGIDIPVYNHIANQMNVDEDLRKRIEGMLQ
jgi:Zn-dependent oligopeptidase